MANERKFPLPDRWSGKELSPALHDMNFGWENINFWTVWQGPVWVGSRHGDWSQGKDSEQGWPLVTGEELAIGFRHEDRRETESDWGSEGESMSNFRLRNGAEEEEQIWRVGKKIPDSVHLSVTPQVMPSVGKYYLLKEPPVL